MPVSNLTNKGRGSGGSAHSFARYMQDYQQAQALSRLINEANCDHVVHIDVGSKFGFLAPFLARVHTEMWRENLVSLIQEVRDFPPAA